MAEYTERTYDVSDTAEIKRIREYIAALKAELARVRSQDPVEFWWDEISRYQRAINTLLAIPKRKRTADQNNRIVRYTEGRDKAIFRYRLARDPKKGGKPSSDPTAWTDITGDVVWAGTSFTQVARTGPGSFNITLKGNHPEFRAGEEIHFEVDDLRVFGGWVASVERGFFFADSTSPKTVLYGTDYNILFDRLAVRNYPSEYATHADTRMSMGPYNAWPNFEQGTLDSEMIEKVFSEYILPDLPLGFDYTSGVETIGTPAPVAPWTMPQAGSSLRAFMQSISQVTTGIWNIDAYMTLQYRDRNNLTPGLYPITDGVGGVSSRNLTVTTDISNMINDIIAWGTLAKNISGEITAWHEWGDIDFWSRRYKLAIDTNQKRLMKYINIPVSDRTAAQKRAIITLRDRIALYKARWADALARTWDPTSGLPRPKNPVVASVDTWGRWQHAEFRGDIFHREWLNMRGHSILTRYDEPIIKATATIWDPYYQAGQVVKVKSSVHDLDADLVIRQMKISFTVPHEPRDGMYYALPQYDLEMGLEPEAPWNIYDYLPYPGGNTPGLGGDRTGG